MSYIGIEPHKFTRTRRGAEERTFTLCHPGIEAIKEAMALQAVITERVAKPPRFQPSIEADYVESMEQDLYIAVYDGDVLAAHCICVRNRETPRNLCPYFDSKEYDAYLTFDTVQVHPDYHGYGLQKFLLREVERFARTIIEPRPCYIAGTVSPDNTPSIEGFLACGFRVEGCLPLYGGERFLMRKTI